MSIVAVFLQQRHVSRASDSLSGVDDVAGMGERDLACRSYVCIEGVCFFSTAFSSVRAVVDPLWYLSAGRIGSLNVILHDGTIQAGQACGRNTPDVHC